MKTLFLIFLFPCLIAWSLSAETDEFGTKTGRTSSVSYGPIDKGKFVVGVGLTPTGSVIAIRKVLRTTTMSSYIYGKTKVAVRHAKGTYRFTAYGAGNGIIITGASNKSLLNIIKRSRSVKIAVVGDDETYVFDINCRGFTNVWRRARW